MRLPILGMETQRCGAAGADTCVMRIKRRQRKTHNRIPFNAIQTHSRAAAFESRINSAIDCTNHTCTNTHTHEFAMSPTTAPMMMMMLMMINIMSSPSLCVRRPQTRGSIDQMRMSCACIRSRNTCACARVSSFQCMCVHVCERAKCVIFIHVMELIERNAL